MKLSGSYQINLSKEKVWEALNNPEILKKAIPGCEEFTKNSDTEFTAKATNKIGPFNASFTGDVELKDLNPPNSYKITGSGNSPVGFASGEAFVKLEDNDKGTKLIYEVEANVGGKIAQVGSSDPACAQRFQSPHQAMVYRQRSGLAHGRKTR